MRKVLLGIMATLALAAAGCNDSDNDSDTGMDANGCYPYQVFCGGKCISPRSDTTYCGACDDCLGANAGVTCQDGHSCQGGVCKSGCAKSQILCDGKCVDPKADATFCGASGNCQDSSAGWVCYIGETCQNGACQRITCEAGRVLCNDTTCIDPNRSAYFCGASDDCQGASRGENCAAAGMKCQYGACVEDSSSTQCKAGEVLCNGTTCVNPNTNVNFCGASGNCQGANAGTNCRALGMACQNGACVEGSSAQCTSSQVLCNGTCINPSTSASYCGASGNCQGSHAGQKCASGQTCQSGTCKTSSSGTTCAATCPSGQACYEGKCMPNETSTSCGIASCTGTTVNTCNNPAHCGGCGPTSLSDLTWIIGSYLTNCQNGKRERCSTDVDCVLDGAANAVCLSGYCRAIECKPGHCLASYDFDRPSSYGVVCVPQTVCQLSPSYADPFWRSGGCRC